MSPDYHHLSPFLDRSLRPDRRPLPSSANEIRMRVKRATTPKGA